MSPITSRVKTRRIWKVYSTEQMAPNSPRKAETSPRRRWSELGKGPKPSHLAAAARDRVPVSAQLAASPGTFWKAPLSNHLVQVPLKPGPGRRGCQALPEELGAEWAQRAGNTGNRCVRGPDKRVMTDLSAGLRCQRGEKKGGPAATPVPGREAGLGGLGGRPLGEGWGVVR